MVRHAANDRACLDESGIPPRVPSARGPRGRKQRSMGFDLRPAAPSAAPEISAREAAARLGVSEAQLRTIARGWFLEPTYSVEETAEYLGCGKWQVQQLVRLGVRYGAALHPSRGGLHPTFKPSAKARRIPLSAIERHKAHMARVHDGALE